MRRLWSSWALPMLLVVALATPPAWAGTLTIDVAGPPLTITTTPAQDSILERLRAISAARGLPYTTVNIMLRAFLVDQLQGRVQEAKQLDAGEGCERYRTLTPAQQAAIDTNFGNSLGLGRAVSPCP